MDPIGLLAAAVAVLVFPGALYLLATGTCARVVGGAPLRLPVPTPGEAAGLVAAALMAAQLPLPGAPARALPDPSGAGTGVLGILLLGAAAVGLAGVPGWDVWRVLAALAAGVPVLALAAAASTLDAATVVGLPGSRPTVARGLAALAILLSAPCLAGLAAAPASGRVRDRLAPPLVCTTFALAAVSVGLPPALAGLPGAVVAVIAAAVAVAIGAALRGPVGRLVPAAAGVAAALAATGCALAVAAPS